MPAKRYPFVLKERVGDDAYHAVSEMIDDELNDRLGAIHGQLAQVNERLGRVEDRLDRLEERFGTLEARVDYKLEKLEARIDDKLTQSAARFDEKLAARDERFERLLTDERAGVRVEISGLRTEMAAQRADLLKWAMVFWVSQAAAVAGIVVVLR